MGAKGDAFLKSGESVRRDGEQGGNKNQPTEGEGFQPAGQ